jgi:hypothetical protein
LLLLLVSGCAGRILIVKMVTGLEPFIGEATGEVSLLDN